MEEYVRKMALWHTKTFTPLMNHEELDPIMSTLGFLGLPPAAASAAATTIPWKEYVYYSRVGVRNHHFSSSSPNACHEQCPVPRLPYPRIDGLHINTYRAFCDAVAYYIGDRDLSDHFHVRGMPLHRTYDRPFDKMFRPMNEEDMLYVYRDGTLDPATMKIYSNTNNNASTNCVKREGDSEKDINHNMFCGHRRDEHILRHNESGNVNIGPLVALKDVIVL